MKYPIMKFTSPKGKEIIFDCWEDETSDEDLGGYWVDMCPSCHNKYKSILGNRCSDNPSDTACCGVKGCDNAVGGWYVDFKAGEVEIIK